MSKRVPHAHTYWTSIPFADEVEKPPVVYLSAPYVSFYRGKSKARWLAAKMCNKIMNKGYVVFCYNVFAGGVTHHTQRIKTPEQWMNQRLTILKRFDEVWVYQLEGWDKSNAVKAEIEFAKNNNIPVKYMTMGGDLHASEFGGTT